MENLFGDNFILDIPTNPFESILIICDTAVKSQELTHYLEALHLLEAMSKEPYTNDVLSNYDYEKCNKATTHDLINFFRDVKVNIQPIIRKQIKCSNLDRFSLLLSDEFSYEFSKENISKIQTLINTLREEIKSSNLFEDKHKQRLLKRLEKLQAEIHKKMSNIDAIWGLVGDAGVALGKFGKDAKPFTDRIIEIAKIGWKTQAQAEDLPEGSKHLLLENTE
jgi:hypothetical protein